MLGNRLGIGNMFADEADGFAAGTDGSATPLLAALDGARNFVDSTIKPGPSLMI
jgi:hypothetical protein